MFDKKIQVIIHILLRDNVTEEEKDSILYKTFVMKGVFDTFLTPDSKVSDIVVYAKWKKKELADRLNDIAIIKGVKTIEHFICKSDLFNGF